MICVSGNGKERRGLDSGRTAEAAEVTNPFPIDFYGLPGPLIDRNDATALRVINIHSHEKINPTSESDTTNRNDHTALKRNF